MIALNARKDKFREQIRKMERQAFFLRERMKLMQSYDHDNTRDMLAAIRSRNNVQQNFQQLNTIINGVNNRSELFRLIEQGLVNQLMAYIEDRVSLKLVFESISYLLERTSEMKHAFNLYERFYSQKLLEYLFIHIRENQLTLICAYLIYTYSQQSQDYCQAIAISRNYKILIEVFVIRVKYGYDQNDKETNKQFLYILQTLENIVMMKEGVIDYDQAKQEVFNFAINLIQQRIILQSAFAIFYQGIKSIGPKIAENHIKLLNQVLYESLIQRKYVHNMLASIYLMPLNHKINYSHVFQAGFKNPKSYKLLSFLMVKMAKENGFIDRIPKEQQNWQRLLIDQEDQQTFSRFLMVISIIQLDYDFVIRMISGSLNHVSTKVQKDLLELLLTKIIQNKNISYVQSCIDKHQIAKNLDPLTISKNTFIKQKANLIMDYILGQLADMSSRMQ